MASAPEKRVDSMKNAMPQQPILTVSCPHCGGRAWFNSPIPEEKPCSCQACGGTGRVLSEN